MERPGPQTNGHSSSDTPAQPGSGGSGDIYKQLINNDMVKELDDIEAISQQISQHAEVLYNSWKTGGLTQGPSQFKISTAAGAPQSPDNSAASSLRERGGSLKQPSHYTRQAGYSDLGPPGYSSVSPRHSTSSVSSPTSSSSRESPARGSSLTQISTEAGPLELLASPNLNGNLEDLVSSFVNTDRAKQAARNTISSTLLRRIGSPNGSSSPVRSPSPSSPLGYRSGSPLRSPMLTNSVPTRANIASPEVSPPAMFPSENQDVHSPIQSIFSKGTNPAQPRKSTSSLHHTLPLTGKAAGASNTNSSDFHKTMKPMFSHSQTSQTSKLSPLHVQTEPSEGGSVAIPVKHIPIAVTPSSSDGLKSPSVLQNANKNPFQVSLQQKPSDQQPPMPNLFNQFGDFRDPEARILEMRRRFEEAKQRMALSLPAREGGIRPNSFGSMGKSSFDSPWADDPSAFLLEQFRRRNKRRMEMPSAPHPELTPEQKQHISDRTNSGLMPAGAPLRRMLPGGSVAERVLMFEKSPSAFGVEPAQVRGVPQRREPQLTGTVITPWRSSLQDLAGSKLQVTRDIHLAWPLFL